MKEVTFTGSDPEYSGVQVGPNFYPLNVPVVVSNSDASALDALEGFKFSIKDAGSRSRTSATVDDAPPAADGFGGSDSTTGIPEEE